MVHAHLKNITTFLGQTLQARLRATVLRGAAGVLAAVELGGAVRCGVVPGGSELRFARRTVG